MSVYNYHFSSQLLKLLCDLLQVAGAAVHAVPYHGYVEIRGTFPSEFLGANLDLFTLALVVPDVGAHQSQILINVNILEPLYSQYMESELANFHLRAHVYNAGLKLLQFPHHQLHADRDQVMRVPIKSPGGLVDGLIPTSLLPPGQWVLVEHMASLLLGGLCVKNSLITISNQVCTKILVILCNESDQAVTL